MNTNNTAPLTAEVVADAVAELTTMIDECREEQAADLAESEHTGERHDLWAYNLFVDVGGVEKIRDMLTALTDQLVERDAELARVTNELAASRNEAVMNYVELTAANRRIAALTEALTELLNIIDRGRQNHLTMDDCINAEHARALATDKEPTT